MEPAQTESHAELETPQLEATVCETQIVTEMEETSAED